MSNAFGCEMQRHDVEGELERWKGLLLRCVVLRCVALLCIALRCIALHCVALHGVAWRGAVIVGLRHRFHHLDPLIVVIIAGPCFVSLLPGD